MSPRTLGMWKALYEIDPWDENRGDYRAAQIAWAVMGASGAKKLDGSAFERGDFLPFQKLQLEPEVVAQQEAQRTAEEVRGTLSALSGHKAKNYQNVVAEE